MAAELNNPIVQRALALAEANPSWVALEVLDAALQGHVNTHPDFEAEPTRPFSDWLDPPSPFAELLRRAFGMHLDPHEASADLPQWQDVIDAFADRYELWR